MKVNFPILIFQLVIYYNSYIKFVCNASLYLPTNSMTITYEKYPSKNFPSQCTNNTYGFYLPTVHTKQLHCYIWTKFVYNSNLCMDNNPYVKLVYNFKLCMDPNW